MTTTNYRREFWQTIYLDAFKYFPDPTQSAKVADDAIREFDERFPAGPAVQVTIEDSFTGSAENIRLRAIVDQYSAQLADYRKAGPQKDIEIERLTREGLIKDQRIKDLENDAKFGGIRIKQLDEMVQFAVRVDEEKDKRIAELEKTIENNGKDAENYRRQCSEMYDDITNKDKRIAELEKNIEDLLAPAVVPEPPKRRTAIEWLEDLPEPYRSQALANRKNRDCGQRGSEVEKVDTLCDALSCSFEWLKSPEGLEYWEEVFIKLSNDEPLVGEMVIYKGLGKAEQAPPMPHQYAEPEAVNKPEPIEEKPTTVKGWLELLEEPYRGKAFANMKKYGLVNGYTYTGSMRMAIAAFNWRRSPEGWDYWADVAAKYPGEESPAVINDEEDN